MPLASPVDVESFPVPIIGLELDDLADARTLAALDGRKRAKDQDDQGGGSFPIEGSSAGVGPRAGARTWTPLELRPPWCDEVFPGLDWKRLEAPRLDWKSSGWKRLDW